MSTRKLVVGNETARAIGLRDEFQQWENKLIDVIREQHGDDSFGDIYGHIKQPLTAIYDLLRYEVGLAIEVDADMGLGLQESEEDEEHPKVNDNAFLMCTSVTLAKDCLEDIEECKDGQKYIKRMYEAHKHLTEAIETYEAHGEQSGKSKSDQLWK